MKIQTCEVVERREIKVVKKKGCLTEGCRKVHMRSGIVYGIASVNIRMGPFSKSRIQEGTHRLGQSMNMEDPLSASQGSMFWPQLGPARHVAVEWS